MSIAYRYLLPGMWLCWSVYWWALSRNVKNTIRREPLTARALHVVPLIVAALLLWVPSVSIAVLNVRFLPDAAWPYWVGAAVTGAGLLFAVWARAHIGRNWSGIVTIKQEHELVTSGPYAFVRHPIYTGLLVAFVGSAMARGEWRGILAVVIALCALWRKLRLEEHWMIEQFGQAYQSYRARVAALIPFIL
jgi:protein-S-isoprenylcysteine O-methyltransferase Ste14